MPSGVIASDDLFGRHIAGIGDIDGDGVPDMAVGASRDDDGAVNAGAVYILFMSENRTAKGY